MEEICETVAETRRLTRVSAVGLVTFTRVSVAAVTAEPYHFFTCFRQVSVEGNKCFRKCNFMLSHGNVPETRIFYISVDVVRPKRSRKYKDTFWKHVFFLFPWDFVLWFSLAHSCSKYILRLTRCQLHREISGDVPQIIFPNSEILHPIR